MWCNVSNAKDCITIEKICLGDSALDYFTKKELKDTEYYYFDDKNFVTSIIKFHSKFKTFEKEVSRESTKSTQKYKKDIQRIH